jgi:hypothetical protein
MELLSAIVFLTEGKPLGLKLTLAPSVNPQVPFSGFRSLGC